MKMCTIARSLLAVICLLLTTPLVSHGEFIRLVKPRNDLSPVLTLLDGESVRVIFSHFRGSGDTNSIELMVILDGEPYFYSRQTLIANWNLQTIVGPATLQITGATETYGYITLQTHRVGDSFNPSNAIVIPSSPSGSVNVVLESSTDLINWSAAIPGSFGSNTEKRFFRVRAELVE